MKYSKIILFVVNYIWVAFISASCEEEKEHPVPDIYVNFSIDIIRDPEFFILQSQGSSVVITASTIGELNLGYLNNGIAVYCAGDGEYYAFDRTCPHDLPASFAVESEDFGASATCPNCGSVFVFPSMGVPTIGSPSNWPLKEYKAILNPNTGILTISSF